MSAPAPTDAPALLRTLGTTPFANDADRTTLLHEAQRLVSRLETPHEALSRMTFQEPTLNLVLRVLDRMGIFAALGAPAAPPQTVEDLARPLDADPGLLKRLLRHAAAKNVVTESTAGYGATPLSALLATETGAAPLRIVAHKFNPIFEDVPAYLQSTGWREPRDARDGPFQASRLGREGETHFEWLARPEAQSVASDFNLLMQFGAAAENEGPGQRGWTDAFPSGELVEGADMRAPLMVDVGGSLGHNARAFRRANPGVGGRVVVQDLAPVIEQALARRERPAGVEFVAHDFFTAQPLSGARFYFMGHVLHDWPDVEAKKILKELVKVMTPGYSKLLLREKVLPAVGAEPHLTSIDIIMMAELAARERSDEQWKALLEGEGLRLKSIRKIEGSGDSVLEADLI